MCFCCFIEEAIGIAIYIIFKSIFTRIRMSEREEEKNPELVTDVEKDLAVAALCDFKK